MNARYKADFEKRHDDWAKKWDDLVEMPFSLSHQKDPEIKKTLTLLANYVGMNNILPNGVVRFFSFHPNRRYAKEVEIAITPYFGFCSAGNVKEILTALKKELLPVLPLIGHGDLSALLSVIEEKTGVDFRAINDADKLRRTTMSASDSFLA